MSLEELGWTEELARSFPEDAALRPARVTSVYGTRVDVRVADATYLASVRARAVREAPVAGGIAVGDWVAVGQAGEAGSNEVVVERILPRRTELLRQAAGERVLPQAIAANIDVVCVVTSLEGDFNPRRLERYLVAIGAGRAEPRVVLTKADLVTDPSETVARVRELVPGLVLVTSARSGMGMEELRAWVAPRTTVAFVGSSGVGKSALMNHLLGTEVQEEGEVRAHDKRGKHTTTRRDLFLLVGGGLVVDTPGMRELKPWLPDEASSLDDVGAWDDIAEVAAGCRYRDCSHAAEPGCAVVQAVTEGRLDAERVASFQKLARERREQSPKQSAFAKVESKLDAKRHARGLAVGLRKRLREKG